jgi:hypothetical protein
MMEADKIISRELRKIPNVGPAMAQDLMLLGISSVEQLVGKEPVGLYLDLEAKTRKRQDPCVLDTFMAVVHYAETGEGKPWWHFTEARKANFRRP